MVKGGVVVKKNFQNMIIVLMLAALVGCLLHVIRQIKCGLIPQIKNDFLRYAEAL